MLTDTVNNFMDTYWKADWDKLRTMVTEDYYWENRPREDLRLSFDEMVEVTLAFHKGKGGYPPVEDGHHIITANVESEDMVAHERMDIWKSGGLWYRVPCGGFWKFRNGLIASWTDYWDLSRMESYKQGNVEGTLDAWTPANINVRHLSDS